METTTERARILDRIRKMLALATNNSEAHEAATAAAMAERLMRKYQIEHAEVLAAEVREAGVGDTKYKHGRKSVPAWVEFIAVGVAKMTDTYARRTAHDGAVDFTGAEEDRALAVEMMVYLVGETNRLAKAHGGTRGELGAFRRGCGSVIGRRLSKLAEERANEFAASQAGTALVVAKKAMIEQHIGGRAEYGKRRSREREAHAYRAGREAGSSVNLSRQVGGRGQQRVR